ncbi:MAG: molybdopterin-synthase adenylyltransferase MoeB [Bdellovibrionota bacterium]
MPTAKDLLAKIKKEIVEVSADNLKKRLDGGEAIALIDVRERDEAEQGQIPGAKFIPRGFLEMRIEDVVHDKSAKVVVYCAGGNRSAFAARDLAALGYTNVESLAGGFNGWKNAGHKFDVPHFLTAEDRQRYSRHLIIPEVGEDGQKKLLASKMLLIGAGGLGSPAALYLAAAGVGTIGIIDNDVVDRSNLQRQILHGEEWIGKPKVDSAYERLRSLNPGIKVVKHPVHLTSENVADIFEPYDVIVDGTDNFTTRYLVNDACVMMNKPNVHGSIFRFEGQATFFLPHDGPCYRCLYPEPTPADMAPSCAEAGVLGVLPGIIGVIQATEAIKHVLGQGKTLVGRLLQYDALDMKFHERRLRRDPECPLCGKSPTIKKLEDLHWSCQVERPAAAAAQH